MRSVRVDDLGRVVAVATGPPRRGWVECPAAADPWRLRLVGREWVAMDDSEVQQRQRDHAPEPPAAARNPVARSRLLKLKGRPAQSISQDELAQAVLDLIDTL